MAVQISALGLILTSYPYLRSAMVRFIFVEHCPELWNFFFWLGFTPLLVLGGFFMAYLVFPVIKIFYD